MLIACFPTGLSRGFPNGFLGGIAGRILGGIAESTSRAAPLYSSPGGSGGAGGSGDGCHPGRLIGGALAIIFPFLVKNTA